MWGGGWVTELSLVGKITYSMSSEATTMHCNYRVRSYYSLYSIYIYDEKGDGEEDKTIKPFAGLHKADKHIITVTAIYFE